ncbi:hypothetical protein [Anaerocolumna chitinilytica]|uniref:Uncharacterized protein n=1 Tax=Anaerocolumna chitinilytica TaxID=1727145 RepID=A0A7I8DJF4_9FIRM|nr:hypothetical protein [Anaerocolumna chitinilytica]BCJ97827.1 hypothetical protein bsdcttw_08680 [Anaerocolumna chitinilytica]
MSFNNINGINNNQSFCNHICRFIGQTVIVFTTSGGVSGSGFTGVLLSVNCNTVRIDSRRGVAPACPLGDSFGGDTFNNDCGHHNNHHNGSRSVGSVCDIPLDSIVAFCHNAI